jgi:hypothetical protein
MRKLLMVSVLTLFIGSAFAHGESNRNYRSDLNIKMWDNSTFRITLNHKITKKTSNFSLKNVSPGAHFVKITKRKKNRYGTGGFVKTIYEGRINVPAKRKVFVKVVGRNRLSFKIFKKPNRHDHGHHNNGHSNQNAYGSNYGSENHFSDWDLGCDLVGNNEGYSGQENFENNGFENSYGLVAMRANHFKDLLTFLKRENFDSDRLAMAKQVLVDNHMNVNQLASILDLLTFDNSKLNFAKAAYAKTIDPENYFLINGKFTFSSSVSELNNYINQRSI